MKMNSDDPTRPVHVPIFIGCDSGANQDPATGSHCANAGTQTNDNDGRNREAESRPRSEQGNAGCPGRIPRIFNCVDCASCCYLSIAGVMIGVGTAVTASTFVQAPDRFVEFEGDVPDEHESKKVSRLWVIGPIFICAGILVLAKAGVQLQGYLRQNRGRVQNAGRRGTTHRIATLPPSYSAVLKTPCGDNRSPADPQPDDRTTETANEPPPSYPEALEVIRKLSPHQMARTREMGVQSDLSSPTTSSNDASPNVQYYEIAESSMMSSIL